MTGVFVMWLQSSILSLQETYGSCTEAQQKELALNFLLHKNKKPRRAVPGKEQIMKMNYQINQIVNINGERGRVIGRNSARILFEQTHFWDDILKPSDRIAFIRLDSGKETYIIF